MSGWERPIGPTPDGSPPRSYWTQPSEADRLSPGQLIRRAWRLYGSAPRRFLLVAAIPELIRDLLAIPSLVMAVLFVQGMFEVMADFFGRVAANPEVYRFADSRALQAELQAQLQAVALPQADLAALSAVGVGAGVAVALIGSSALTAAALATAAGRPISVAGAFRLVAARREGLLYPIVVLGIGWVAVSSVLVLLQTSADVQTWAGATGSPRSVLIGSLLAVLALVVTIGIVVLAVRWALFIPAVLVESLGLGPGLARGAQLTRAIRIRMGLAMAAILILHSLSVGIVAMVVGVAVGLSAGSVALGIGAYLIASLVGNLLWAPLLPAMLAFAYRERTGDAEASAPAGT